MQLPSSLLGVELSPWLSDLRDSLPWMHGLQEARLQDTSVLEGIGLQSPLLNFSDLPFLDL